MVADQGPHRTTSGFPVIRPESAPGTEITHHDVIPKVALDRGICFRRVLVTPSRIRRAVSRSAEPGARGLVLSNIVGRANIGHPDRSGGLLDLHPVPRDAPPRSGGTPQPVLALCCALRAFSVFLRRIPNPTRKAVFRPATPSRSHGNANLPIGVCAHPQTPTTADRASLSRRLKCSAAVFSAAASRQRPRRQSHRGRNRVWAVLAAHAKQHSPPRSGGNRSGKRMQPRQGRHKVSRVGPQFLSAPEHFAPTATD
jgi:hypothetical protein